MNYPVWDVAIGGGLLIAIVSIVHVFVSHFAIGAGLFLVISEQRAYRRNDDAFIGWLARNTKFFALLSVVFGAISGVGIWFTIGLVHPSATSALIRSYVWAWAVEWLFFFLEITAALMYWYGWKTLDRATHLWVGWIYFGAAFMSMVVINGIITFMLTPGGWLQSGRFWDGFLNPTYLPSLGLRLAFSVALAGIYALVTSSRETDRALRSRVTRWSAAWIVPAAATLPAFAAWYIAKLPAGVWQATQGRMPTATRYASLILIASAIALVGALWALLKPKSFPIAAAVVVFLAAFVTMWSFEFIRESIRKPYVIYGYMYSNSILARPDPLGSGLDVASIRRNGLLASARWSRFSKIDETNELDAGHEVFRLECQSCHTLQHYRSLRRLIRARGWDQDALFARIGSLDKMIHGAMPPFAGTEAEKRALARFLSSLNPDVGGRSPEGAKADGRGGRQVFEQDCGSCHMDSPDDPLFLRTVHDGEQAIFEKIGRLHTLNPAMPPFTGTQEERKALAAWIAAKPR